MMIPMAHVPMGDIQELWNQTSQHSWSALHQTLEEHKGKAQGIEDSLVDMMLQATQNLEHSHEKYPDNPQQLYDIMNKYVEQRR
jgi:hypothetical protein